MEPNPFFLPFSFFLFKCNVEGKTGGPQNVQVRMFFLLFTPVSLSRWKRSRQSPWISCKTVDRSFFLDLVECWCLSHFGSVIFSLNAAIFQIWKWSWSRSPLVFVPCFPKTNRKQPFFSEDTSRISSGLKDLFPDAPEKRLLMDKNVLNKGKKFSFTVREKKPLSLHSEQCLFVRLRAKLIDLRPKKVCLLLPFFKKSEILFVTILERKSYSPSTSRDFLEI